MRLDLGAGTEPWDRERFKTVDLYAEADYKADILELPFEDDSIEEIRASHVLEHIAMAEVPKALKEWLRVLKPGGKAIIIVPNFDYVARYWMTGENRIWAEQLVFGLQTNPGEFHKAAFNVGILRGDLEGTGWEVVRIEHRVDHGQETLQAVCRKPVNNGRDV